MTQDEDNITTMFETTNGILDQNTALWSGTPAFADAVTRAKSATAAIRQKQADQMPTGDTPAKQNARDAAEDQGWVIASQLSALAAKTNDPMLAAKVNFDRSALDKMAVSDLIAALGSIAGAAAEHAAVLASDYGVTAGDLTAFDTARGTLDGMKDAPREAIADRKVATMSMPAAVRFTRKIYRNELDKMMAKFKAPEPDFYGAYFNGRIIIDRTGTHAAAKKTPTTPGNS